MQLFKKHIDGLYLAGLALIITSLVFFMLPNFFPPAMTSGPGMFMINYLIAAGYLIALIFSGRMRRGRNGLHPLMLFLILFLISAYALNREMAVFERSTGWFCIVLVLISMNYIAFALFEKLPEWLKHLLCIVAGLAMIVFIYLSLYLIPIYVLSAVAFFALGISLHAFVPALFCVYTWSLINHISKKTTTYRRTFVAGMAITFLFAVGYAIRYDTTLKSINHLFRYASITENDQLPGWIHVAEQMPKNDMAEKILKTDLVYAVPDTWKADFFLRMPRLNFEQKVHDPLVMLSSLICGKINVPEENRIKILETLYDSRHQAQERLWSGEDITTEHIDSHVQLWPNLRLSYSQLDITIAHIRQDESRSNKQEAIYTFHLPEGGVVTSLSLWIDGKEEKGILTSRAKADSAYRQIVGIEQRDPSVVHWQEGNTVTVRVFPVVFGESRKFKLGITAPLRAENDQLYYDNIYFDGPSFNTATENISITAMDAVQKWSLPAGFIQSGNIFTKKGTFDPSWSFSFTAPPLSGNTFHFDRYSYQIVPIKKETESFNAASVYLDINASWPLETCEQVYQLVKFRNVYVSEGGDSFTRINEGNRKEIFESLRQNHFSLFPFYKIAAGSSSLIITHSGSLSPTIHDIEGSGFLNQTKEYFKNNTSVHVFDIGPESSPYLKSLKEFRVLQYDHGDQKELEHILSADVFNKVIESDDEIAVGGAGISIRRTNDSLSGHAPDHLMRIFAYNHILGQAGRMMLTDTTAGQAIVEEAQQAYVVSPVSSLVVLETQKDYDRFDITSSKNSLQNAALKSKGAVPEPEEWALIIVALTLAALIKFSPRLLFKSSK